MTAMTGRQIKERLERDLGFEANRARLLTEATASSEIATYWVRKGMEKLDEKTYSAIAKTALISGLVGRQKLNELINRLDAGTKKESFLIEVVTEISALVLEHQKTLNLSRNRASCVNAHLNVLEPERALPQVYSPHLNESDLKKAKLTSTTLLKQNITNASDFLKWLKDVHNLLAVVSNDDMNSSKVDEMDEGIGKKGLISRKAISTYQKQWELFAKEKLGPSFSIEVKETDASPLTGRLNELENGSSRTWTTMLDDITEAKTSTIFQKRTSLITERATQSLSLKNVNNYEFQIGQRPLKIQLSFGVTEENVAQFVKAMKAQFLVYSGKGQLNVTLQTPNSIIAISIDNAAKSDLSKIHEILLELI